ncbi:DUF4149 domain-containing protein [Hydrogenovibrio sp. 3SP14C1]|uniref:DUF4149 domain-containing protein n=1 Tax=Hydrogenovibrio sp. 3SP14C1 TaxID=3038774 RepID=UPI002417EEDB|nr:DUF4149 domain-containing protein [Hydrogenovibrio sp. 3SP14C1]MDG4813501.1 DUF4149 domain-containing protein [Hydrogenovibrio sp. 3SP14C1]
MIQALVVTFLSINITIGYIVASVLFKQLASTKAGSIMEQLLSGLYLADVLILIAILGILFIKKQFGFKKHSSLLASLGLVLGNGFYVFPLMTKLKILGADATVLSMNFSGWHAVSQIIFMLTLGFVLFWWLVVYQRTYSASFDKGV